MKTDASTRSYRFLSFHHSPNHSVDTLVLNLKVVYIFLSLNPT